MPSAQVSEPCVRGLNLETWAIDGYCMLLCSMSVALLNMQAGCSHGKSENWQWPPLPTLSHFSLLGKIGFGLY